MYIGTLIDIVYKYEWCIEITDTEWVTVRVLCVNKGVDQSTHRTVWVWSNIETPFTYNTDFVKIHRAMNISQVLTHTTVYIQFM